MRAGALGLVLAAAGTVACGALAAQPAWRVADNHRALEIGLRAKDIGPGWATLAAPRNIDLGEIASSTLTAACSSPVPATKAAVDLDVTGASLGSFGGAGASLTSIAMLFKTPTMARLQIPTGGVAGLRSCLRSQLQEGLGKALKASLSSVKRIGLDNGSPHSYVIRAAGKLSFAAGSQPFLLDLVMQNDGRGIAETAYVWLGTPPDEAVEKRLARLLETRLARYAS